MRISLGLLQIANHESYQAYVNKTVCCLVLTPVRIVNIEQYIETILTLQPFGDETTPGILCWSCPKDPVQILQSRPTKIF